MSIAMTGRISLEQARSLVAFLESDQQDEADAIIEIGRASCRERV